MEKESFQPLSGFRDSLGPTKSWVISELQKTFQEYGYQALETPAIERQEILLGKLGEEGQKQLYLFEDNGKRNVGLRYDLTVPLARFVAGNLGQIALPFKRYEIGSSWRAERPQKGRYRQFTQADVDIIGAPEPSSELELFSVVATASERLGVKLTCLINDRRIVTAVLEDLKVPTEMRNRLLQLLDKKDKIDARELSKELDSLGLTAVQKKAINGRFLTDEWDPFAALSGLTLAPEGVLRDSQRLLGDGARLGFATKFDLSMVRGLDYYTGTIFEFKADNYDGGTVVGGGRYDSLIEGLTGQKVPAVGLSFGVDRLSDLLSDQAQTDTLFIVRLPETTVELNAWVRQLRKDGLKVEVYLDESVELGKQIKYADKRGYKTIIIPLEEAWKKGQVEIKNLETGKQEAVKRDEITNG